MGHDCDEPPLLITEDHGAPLRELVKGLGFGTESARLCSKGAHIIYRSVKLGTQGRLDSTKRLSHG